MSLSPNSVQAVRDPGDSVVVRDSRCPICKQRITRRVDDPATAVTAKRFLQLMHATNPEAYHAACKRNPVRRNFLLEIASREILTDFSQPTTGDTLEEDGYDSNQPVLREVNKIAYRHWMEQQFRG